VPATVASQIGVSPIGPERSRGVDVGIEQGFAAGHARARVAYFDNAFTDLIEFVSKTALPRVGVPPSAANATAFGAYVNSQSNRSKGVETSGEARVGRVRLNASYMFLDAVVTRSFSSGALAPAINPSFPTIPIGAFSPLVGARPFRRPANSGSVMASYSEGKTLVSIAGYFYGKTDDSTFLSDQFFGNSLLLPNKDLDPAYQKFDLNASYRVHPRVRWYLTIENLFDEQYHAASGFPALPCTARTGLSLTIGGDRTP
jgi:iron complex outermembrane receptor protein/vitamin B12 transporter